MSSHASDSRLDHRMVAVAEMAASTQEALDQALLDDLRRYRATTEAVLEHIDPSLSAWLAPPRQHVQEMTLSMRVDLRVQHGAGCSLTVDPLGSGFARRFSTSTETASTFAVTVTSRPGIDP